MRSFKHWTPRYVVDRLMLFAYERTHPHAPWLNKTIVEILQSWLRPEDRGVEWGSGRSTVWFAQRVSFLVSVEHDEYWYRKVGAALTERGLRNVEYHLCPTEAEYCSLVDTLPRESFDFCLVDGIVRDVCVMSAIPLLKSGGVLVVDNSNWFLPNHSRSPFSIATGRAPASDKWARFLHQVSGWRTLWTSNGVFDTALWVKP